MYIIFCFVLLLAQYTNPTPTDNKNSLIEGLKSIPNSIVSYQENGSNSSIVKRQISQSSSILFKLYKNLI